MSKLYDLIIQTDTNTHNNNNKKGILLRRLESDRYLNGVTHVVVDEVHERTIESDFLLIVLKKLRTIRTDLR